MKRISLISLTLIATLSGACSSQSEQNPPEQQSAPRKRVSQALTGVSLEEVAVPTAVREAAGSQVTVRAFQIQLSEGGSASVADVMPVALERGASDLTKGWQADPERDADETRTALKFAEGVLPAIEAELGTGEAFSSGYYHSWEAAGFDQCNHGGFYGVLFPQSGKVFTIEVAGTTEC
jgi:hypothetical protein